MVQTIGARQNECIKALVLGEGQALLLGVRTSRKWTEAHDMPPALFDRGGVLTVGGQGLRPSLRRLPLSEGRDLNVELPRPRLIRRSMGGGWVLGP